MIYFLRKHLAYNSKPIPMEEKNFQKLKNRYFQVLKCSYFVLKVFRGLVTN